MTFTTKILIIAVTLLGSFCVDFSLIAQEPLTQQDIENAVEFAKNYYPIAIAKSFWIVVNDKNESVHNDDFIFSKVHLNSKLLYRSSFDVPHCYFGIRDNDYFLLVDNKTAKKINIPDEYLIRFVLNHDALLISSQEKRRSMQLYQPSSGDFPAGTRIVTTYREGIVYAYPPSMFEKGGTDAPTLLLDASCRILHELPCREGGHRVTYNLLGEGVIAALYTPIDENKRNSPAEYQTKLYDLQMNHLATLENPWYITSPFDNGRAVCRRRIAKIDELVFFALCDKSGHLTAITENEIFPGREGIHRFKENDSRLEG